MAMIVTMAIR
jgi:hypothetical protein